ncbi:MAG: Flp family type IVb pilin [Alphaproteobacteria bacterium]|nr:Flp family type IVb pilin [Alphaproteobacteria bacterium]MBU6472014.1 Flp family type IVb pilin [Alphaproteobacteria bacterium]MDE2014788.1 Flp family type IVb pilin [Alphaproteobacteria bacterium]MDE2075035.1 Flp family type IVb pilin [Alphaproteobacteria bacterium]MDE2352749.1 Flp family type IVb pilin [Alphaproteobacteria bacterium]
MGQTAGFAQLPDASGRRPPDPGAARSVALSFAGDRSGATAVEYAIVAAGIALAVVTAVTLLGGQVLALFESIHGL